jgi:hypothetical protein
MFTPERIDLHFELRASGVLGAQILHEQAVVHVILLARLLSRGGAGVAARDDLIVGDLRIVTEMADPVGNADPAEVAFVRVTAAVDRRLGLVVMVVCSHGVVACGVRDAKVVMFWGLTIVVDHGRACVGWGDFLRWV